MLIVVIPYVVADWGSWGPLILDKAVQLKHGHTPGESPSTTCMCSESLIAYVSVL